MAPVTEEECKLYDHIDFDMEEFAKDVGAETLLHSCKVLPHTCTHTHIHTVQATRVPQAGMPTMQRHPGSKVILRELCSRVIKSRVWLS